MVQVTHFQRQASHDDLVERARQLVPHLRQRVKEMDQLGYLPETTVQSANRTVYQHNQERGDNMGTMMTAALIMDTTAYVAHVGDSRCYLYRKPTGLSLNNVYTRVREAWGTMGTHPG
jgi:serine/threonine protein phosphatase PrpC